MIKPLDRVLKFGGAALQDADGVRRVVRLAPARSARPAVVVSAHFGVTRALEEAWRAAASGEVAWDAVRIRHRTLVRELGLSSVVIDALLRELGTVLGVLARQGADDPHARDLVLSFGERLSARVVAAALRAAGTEAFAADAFDLGLTIDARGEPTAESAGRVRARLAAEVGIPVVTGFLALDGEGRVTTLGPDGSDLTAAWLGRALGVERVELFKAVPGWLTVAPEEFAGGLGIERLPRVLARELAARGATVVHPRALEVAGDVELAVLDVRDPAKGTVLATEEPAAGRAVALTTQRDARGVWVVAVGGGIGFDQAFVERWTRRVGEADWLQTERARNAFAALVRAEHRASVLERWHAALLDEPLRLRADD